jgi:hypothetical protein
VAKTGVPPSTILSADGLTEDRLSTYNGDLQGGGIEVYRQLGTRGRPQGEFPVAGEDHEPDPLSFRNDLVVRL